MKFKLITLAAAVALLSQGAFSAPLQRGAVNFTGLITQAPIAACGVNLADANKTVDLGIEDVSKVGKTFPTVVTPFHIGLTCDASYSKTVGAYFDNAGGMNQVASDYNIISNGTAKNVEIEMFNDQGGKIKLGLVGMSNSGSQYVKAAKNVSLVYQAGYLSSPGNTATAGTVSGQITYVLVYN